MLRSNFRITYKPYYEFHITCVHSYNLENKHGDTYFNWGRKYCLCIIKASTLDTFTQVILKIVQNVNIGNAVYISLIGVWKWYKKFPHSSNIAHTFTHESLVASTPLANLPHVSQVDKIAENGVGFKAFD